MSKQDYEEPPSEDPPAYSVIAEHGEVSLEGGLRRNRPSAPQLPPRQNNSRPQQPVPPNRPLSSQPQKKTNQFRYPSGYKCHKCGNTGYSLRSGRKCKICVRNFGDKFRPPQPAQHHQNYGPPPQVIPYNVRPVFNVQPRILPPGHPGIGGKLCRVCGGKGLTYGFFSDDQCYNCNGIGRVFR